MTAGSNSDESFSELELAWIRGHLKELRASATDPSITYWYLGSALVLGLVAQIVGYLLRPATPSEPLGLIADLVYALGLTLWTGVVVTVFVQVLPDLKRRQIRRVLERFEAGPRADGTSDEA